MSNTIAVELNGLHFFSEHGMYSEEMKVGNEFEVDVCITIKAPKKPITAIAQTINYAEVHRIIKEEMNVRRVLLETWVMQVADKLYEQFPNMRTIKISIKKLNPPIANSIGSAAVTIKKSF
jgi:dihydroneopterin aldolase